MIDHDMVAVRRTQLVAILQCLGVATGLGDDAALEAAQQKARRMSVPLSTWRSTMYPGYGFDVQFFLAAFGAICAVLLTMAAAGMALGSFMP